jgi:phytol kinase
VIVQIAAAVLCALLVVVIAAATHRIGMAFALSDETQRKTVHVCLGISAMLLPQVLDRLGFAVFVALALVALLILRLPQVAASGPGASIHSVQRRSWGDLHFLFSLTVLFLLSAGDPEFYILPLAVLTVSDAAAALIGTEYGRRRYGSAGREKSIEGTAAFFVVTWIVTVSIFIEHQGVPRQNVIWLATAISAMAAVIEADSWRGLDNLFVPLGVYCILIGWYNAEPHELEFISLVWVAALIAARWAAPPLGMTPHALRATFIAFFITFGIADRINIVLPAIAFFCHLGARRVAGEERAEHDLDFVTLLTTLGVIWLGASAVFNRNAIEFFTMTFAGLAAGYATFAVPGRSLLLRLGVATVATAAAVMLHHRLCLGLQPHELWAPRLVVWTACTLAASLCATVAALRPAGMLRGSPNFKLAWLAFFFPALAYGLEAAL